MTCEWSESCCADGAWVVCAEVLEAKHLQRLPLDLLAPVSMPF
jgi:hypothetical protein